MKQLYSFAGVFALAFVFFSQPEAAQALTIQVQECAIQQFPCVGANIIAQGQNTDGVGILGAGGFSNFAYNFANADVAFNGTITAANLGGILVLINGTGTATSLLANNPFFLNVDIFQTYVTVPQLGTVSEYNNGNCNAAAVAAGSTVLATLAVNGAALPVLGNAATCTAPVGGNFNFALGPFFANIGNLTTFDGLAQFQFNGGAAGQAIDLPYGETDAPEPGSMMMFGTGAIGLAGFAIRRRNRLV